MNFLLPAIALAALLATTHNKRSAKLLSDAEAAAKAAALAAKHPAAAALPSPKPSPSAFAPRPARKPAPHTRPAPRPVPRPARHAAAPRPVPRPHSAPRPMPYYQRGESKTMEQGSGPKPRVVTAPVAQVVYPPGMNAAKARNAARDVATHLRQKGRAGYSHKALKVWQRLAGIAQDGVYGHGTHAALKHFGANPPDAFFNQGTESYPWSAA